ncbi:LysR family transcriptional regulator [Nocardia tenerifensis]|uniref:LysR family transcriptional regulator n=1 Tax=Nocardia tenerifensis TaxID=228006 RepID=A0A318K5F2_9NOCA|nr:LysR family transcriptional regulator [Nocardia tenerifensis]PXX64154.1 LysR family transcriptional regulator [Nocardia tenerifensis]
MSLEVRELEAFLVLAEELHFGRAGERLYVSQSRVSQLLRALEQRVGARLIERTSRKVALTPLGENFLADLRPAYTALHATVDSVRAAARGMQGVLRIGFQGSTSENLTDALALFERRFPACTAEVVEIPLSDPFGPVHRGEVDLAVVLLPMGESDLVLGQVFSEQQQMLAMHRGHPLAARTSLSPEDLAEFSLVGVRGPAPHYWRRAQSLDVTPGGRPVPAGPQVGTLWEGIEAVAGGQGAMLLCHPTAVFHDRPEVNFVPVTGLAHSRLGLVWHRNRETTRVRAFSRAVAAVG